jgi:hypothetical protein
MKLRIHGNAVRLRLNQAEVGQFSKTGWLEEAIEFAPGVALVFSLESLSSVPAPRAHYQNGALKIQVPSSIANAWVTSDEVGMEGEQPIAHGKRLAILIEKDFQCVHDAEPDADAYPNPLQETAGPKTK